MTISEKTLYNKTNGIIDLSELNIFDTVKHIVMLTTNNIKTNPAEKLKFKVSSQNVRNLLNDLPVSNMVEIV